MKRNLLAKEDWDKPLDTLLEAFDLDELKIFLRRASDEQLKGSALMIEEEFKRLKAAYPDSCRLVTVEAAREELWEAKDTRADIERRRRRIELSKQSNS